MKNHSIDLVKGKVRHIAPNEWRRDGKGIGGSVGFYSPATQEETIFSCLERAEAGWIN